MEDLELTKKYYRINEVSEMLDVAQSTLRYWEQEFSQLKPTRNAKGTRYYSPKDIDIIKQIRFLVHDKGLKIEAAAKQMKVATDTVTTHQKAMERLIKVRDELSALSEALGALGR